MFSSHIRSFFSSAGNGLIADAPEQSIFSGLSAAAITGGNSFSSRRLRPA